MSSPPKLFNLKHSLLAEMNNFQKLMQSDGEKGREVLVLGEAVLQHASQGLLRKFIAAATELSRTAEAPLFYFLTKALVEALKRGHLMVASFILDNGFTLHDPNLPHILNLVIRDDIVNDNVALIAVQFLHRYLYDFNLQEKITYWAPIHYAVQRSFFRTIENLIELGADVNIVADKDIMPLNVALEKLANPQRVKSETSLPAVDTLKLSQDDSSDPKGKLVSKNPSNQNETQVFQKESIDDTSPEFILAQSVVELLKKHNAKETWRRGISVQILPQNEAFSAIGAPRESSSISAASSSSSSSSSSKNVTGISNPSTSNEIASKKNMVRFSSANIFSTSNSSETAAASETISPSTHNDINSNSLTFSTASSTQSNPKSNFVRFSSASLSGASAVTSNDNSLPTPPSLSSERKSHPVVLQSSGGGGVAGNGTEEGGMKEETAVGVTEIIYNDTEDNGTVFLGVSDDGNAFLFSTGG